jgi:hypothetical protein
MTSLENVINEQTLNKRYFIICIVDLDSEELATSSEFGDVGGCNNSHLDFLCRYTTLGA